MKNFALHAALLAAIAVSLPCAADDHSDGSASKLMIKQSDVAREILKRIPAEAALERFELLTADNELISYVGLTQGPVGGVVFKNSQLLGTITPAEAQAYYACRGYTTARNHYWAENASEWGRSLLGVVAPASEVQLEFTGETTLRSITSVITNPAFNQVKSIVEIGTNPLNIFKTLRNARSNYKDHERDQELTELLSAIKPGSTEKLIAQTLNPEDITFLDSGIVMAYPKFSIDFMVSQAKVTVIQQPSFHQLAAVRASIFYIEGLDWTKCRPDAWAQSVVRPASE